MAKPALFSFAHQNCGCEWNCGDDGDIDGHGICKGLPPIHVAPLVEIILVPRDAEYYRG